MKKLKESLWFLIPFLILSVVSVVYFVLSTNNEATFFRSIISVPYFIVALIYAFNPSLIISFAVVLIYKIALRFLFKKTVENRKKYIYIFLVSLIAPVLYVVITTRAFDLVSNTIFTLQTGIIVTFVFWMIDIITEKINKKKLFIIIGVFVLFIGLSVGIYLITKPPMRYFKGEIVKIEEVENHLMFTVKQNKNTQHIVHVGRYKYVTCPATNKGEYAHNIDVGDYIEGNYYNDLFHEHEFAEKMIITENSK